MEAIILAGGLGTRLRSVVSDVPKPMAPVGGVPFLERLLAYWGAQGVDRFILSIGHLSDQITTHFGHSFRGKEIAYAIEETPAGTGGALILASRELKHDCPFLVINGDTFFEVPLIQLWRFHQELKAEITVALTAAPPGTRYGRVERDPTGRIVSFAGSEVKDSPYVNGGIYLSELGLWDEAQAVANPVSLEKELFPGLIASGVRMVGVPFTGRFIDIGVPEDYFAAESLLVDSIAKSTDK
jgi:D-glycero-alpha-D-manno-heptose 1-phosphate guanylyltransferase